MLPYPADPYSSSQERLIFPDIDCTPSLSESYSSSDESTSSSDDTAFSLNEITSSLGDTTVDDDQIMVDTEHRAHMKGRESYDAFTIYKDHLAVASEDEKVTTMKGSIDEEDPTHPMKFSYSAEKRKFMIPTGIKELTAYFVHDESLGPLLTMAFEKDSVGGEEFEHKFSILLKEFSKELECEAQEEDQRATARIAGIYAALISHEIRCIKEGDLQERSSEEAMNYDINLPQVLVSQYPVTDEQTENSEFKLQDEDQNSDVNVLELTALWTSTNSLLNLRHKLSRVVQPDVFQAIRSEMSPDFEPPGIQQVTFRVQWELMRYIEEELPCHSGLASVLTISGNAKTAYATSCDEYMSRLWRNTGRDTLHALEAAINCGQKIYESPQSSCGLRYLVDLGTRLEREECEDIRFTISGCESDLFTEIAHQLAWLSAVFRIPTYDKLTLSDVVFERIKATEYRLFPLDLRPVNERESPCWHPVFTNGVIAHGFPVPPRHHEERGIELPFQVMITLARVKYTMEYDDGTVFKGPSTILIPTARNSNSDSNSVQWHFISGVPKKRLSMNSIADHVSDWFKTFDISLLQEARTFLGYCKNAEIHLGTADSCYGDIGKSNAEYEGSTAGFPMTSLNLGFSGMGINAGVQTSITYSRGLQAMVNLGMLPFNEQLNIAKDQPLLIYDTEDKRGWLVSELSVILHIALAWVLKQSDFSNVLNLIPRAAVSGNGGEAAFAAIMEGGNIQLRTNLDGRPQFFSDVVRFFMDALECRKHALIKRQETSNRSLLSRRQPLRGWEFVDIVRLTSRSIRKQITINRSSGGEWDLIAAKNPELIVLFGKGFGEIIKPARDERICQSWNPIPKGHCYLTASGFCLKILAETHSIDPTLPRLTPKFHWHRPQKTRLFEDCDFGVGVGCNRLQGLKSKRKKSLTPGPLEPNGAVIFGKATTSSRASCKPVERELEPGAASSTPEEASPPSSDHPSNRKRSRSSSNDDTISASRSSRDVGRSSIEHSHDAGRPPTSHPEEFRRILGFLSGNELSDDPPELKRSRHEP